METTEIWKDIPGWEGRYQASTAGRIRKANGWYPKNSLGDAQGHLVVRLSRPRARVYVHQLILLTFVGPRDGRDCRHLDGSKTNNALSNLVYGTRRENSIDMVYHQTNKRLLGPERVLEIKKRLASGEFASSIARDYGVCKQTIQRIRQGRRYAYLKL